MIKMLHLIKPTSISIYKYLCVENISAVNVIIRSRALNTEATNDLHEDDVKDEQNANNPLMDFKGLWPARELELFKNDMKLIPNFITELEETQLIEEVDPYMHRLRYEFDHWDDAIHGFRETERKHWYPHNRSILQRVSKVGFEGKIMPYIHILDLAPEGIIKPHIDSTRYCGDTIAGLSLLSEAVMRLVYTKVGDHKADKIENEDNYRNQPKTVLENNFYVDILLPCRSLYIMSHTARYNFTHEILANQESKFQGKPLKKQRRISIICRNDP